MRASAAQLLTALMLVVAVVFMATAEPPETPQKPPPKRESRYAGNIKTKKFHLKGCRYFDCPNCLAKFATREEALEAGFDPCGTCRP